MLPISRRLVERGVRFLPVLIMAATRKTIAVTWDAHENLRDNHTNMCRRADQAHCWTAATSNAAA